MTPLIDADILLYEVGFGCEIGWKSVINWKEEDGEIDPPPFDYVERLLTSKIDFICEEVGATQPPILFLTGKTNFREGIAKKKKYKSNRVKEKPFHYHNIKAYILGQYNVVMEEGLEADDLLTIFQYADFFLNPHPDESDVIVCSRDKDVRQSKGWHYGWEVGKQPSFGPYFVSGYGHLEYNEDKNDLKGVGDKFFLAQCLMGDPVDSIPGLPKCGPKKAFKLIEATSTYEEGLEAVREAYRASYGDTGDEELLEQGQLLWMVKEKDDEGNPIMWKL